MIHRLIIMTGVLVAMLTVVTGNSFAMDENGCLTCHQYPGLVRPEKGGGFKVLHIDLKRYEKSPHGKIDCTKCHVSVKKVPHVGETSVNCTNGCHQGEKNKKLIEEFDLKSFHAGEKSYITALADGSSCRECHELYPHRSNKLARAFINMHISFMTCETCHINTDNYKSLRYEWTNSETAEFAGEPFGARFNPKLGDASESAHFISRISVFSEENGTTRSLQDTRDTDLAKAYLKEEKQLNVDQKEEKLRYFHRDIHKSEISVTCNECHSKHTILDFKQLGFPNKRATDLINLNIKGLVTKYEVFYFPEMFRQ
jgi:hypothetical protein